MGYLGICPKGVWEKRPMEKYLVFMDKNIKFRKRYKVITNYKNQLKFFF